jgi:nicotinamidase-related amidase
MRLKIIKKYNLVVLSLMVIVMIILSAIGSYSFAGDERTIVELWNDVEVPAPVELKVVKVNPKETAFLILDIEERTCNSERRPRCVASVSKIQSFLEEVRAEEIAVVYSLTSRGTPETILSEVAPIGNEPIVKSSVDKFYNTELESILREKGITTVIITGTTAEGAVLHTATGAAMRGFQVIVPIDGMSAGTLYAEQYTAWHLINAPGSRQRTTMTNFEMIEF